MPLSNKDLSDIATEFAKTKSDSSDAKNAIPDIQDQITKTQAQADRLYVLYRNANNERVDPYQTERRWLDGTTYTPITEQQINDSGNRLTGNIFFPPSWQKSNAFLTTSGNGNPTTTSLNSESGVLNATVANGGLISQINLLRNGQSSVRPDDNLFSSYSPGDPTIIVDDTGHTNGNLLYISGSGTSALVLITNVAGTTLTITEIIAPASTISGGGSVVEDIPGFSNAERQNLTSGSYQRILTELTNRIATAAGLWNTALTNQLAQLNLNIDNPTQINAAKTSVQTGQTSYSTWSALPNTGVTGKYTNTSLDNLATGYNTRNSGISARATQITTALGVVTQSPLGDYSGNGVYLQRFKCLNFLINGANGPLFQLIGLNGAIVSFQQKIANNADKLATFTNVVRYGAFTANADGTGVVKIENPTQFSISDTVIVNGTDLPSIEATISNISGTSVTLNKNIPKEYTKDTKASLIKKA